MTRDIKFKVGDWVRQSSKLPNTSSLPSIGIVGELKEVKSVSPLNYGDSKWVQIDKSIPSSIFIDIEDVNDETYSYELWEPKEGEKILVWNNNCDLICLATFLTMDGNMYCTSEKLCGNSYWDNCIPFLGKLPNIY